MPEENSFALEQMSADESDASQTVVEMDSEMAQLWLEDGDSLGALEEDAFEGNLLGEFSEADEMDMQSDQGGWSEDTSVQVKEQPRYDRRSPACLDHKACSLRAYHAMKKLGFISDNENFAMNSWGRLSNWHRFMDAHMLGTWQQVDRQINDEVVHRLFTVAKEKFGDSGGKKRIVIERDESGLRVIKELPPAMSDVQLNATLVQIRDLQGEIARLKALLDEARDNYHLLETHYLKDLAKRLEGFYFKFAGVAQNSSAAPGFGLERLKSIGSRANLLKTAWDIVTLALNEQDYLKRRGQFSSMMWYLTQAITPIEDELKAAQDELARGLE